MKKRTVEASKRRFIKRIERLEEKQKYLIDRLVYDVLPEKKQFFIKEKIKNITKKIQTCKNSILFECRQSYGRKVKK